MKVGFTNCHNTQLFINIRVLLLQMIGECGISMYIHNSLNFKSWRDLDINTKNPESINSINIRKARFCQWSMGLQIVILKLLKLLWKIYIPFPWSPISFSMPPRTLNWTFLITTKMKNLFLNVTFGFTLVPVINKPTWLMEKYCNCYRSYYYKLY